MPQKTVQTKTCAGDAMEPGDIYVDDKCARDTDEEVLAVIRRWDRELSKTKLFNRYSQMPSIVNTVSSTTVDNTSRESFEETEDEKLPDKNPPQRSKIPKGVDSKATTAIVKQSNSFVRGCSTSSKIGLQPSVVDELESVVTKIKQLANKLIEIKRESAVEKCSNAEVLSSYTLTMDKCSKHETERQMRNEQKRIHENMVENALSEKNDLLQRCAELKSALENANNKRASLFEQYGQDSTDIVEKIKEIEEERCGWDDYKRKLEDQIAKTKNTLALKDEFINNQCSQVENLVLDKQNTSIQLQSNESEHYKNEIVELYSVREDWNSKLTSMEELHNIEMSKMKILLNDKNKLIETKNELINQQNTVLSLMEEMTLESTDITNYEEDEQKY